MMETIGWSDIPGAAFDQSRGRERRIHRLDDHIAILAGRISDVPLHIFLVPHEMPPTRQRRKVARRGRLEPLDAVLVLVAQLGHVGCWQVVHSREPYLWALEVATGPSPDPRIRSSE